MQVVPGPAETNRKWEAVVIITQTVTVSTLTQVSDLTMFTIIMTATGKCVDNLALYLSTEIH